MKIVAHKASLHLMWKPSWRECLDILLGHPVNVILEPATNFSIYAGVPRDMRTKLVIDGTTGKVRRFLCDSVPQSARCPTSGLGS
jgi:hypothetical protein